MFMNAHNECHPCTFTDGSQCRRKEESDHGSICSYSHKLAAAAAWNAALYTQLLVYSFILAYNIENEKCYYYYNNNYIHVSKW